MSLTSLARVNACLAACQYNQNNPIRLAMKNMAKYAHRQHRVPSELLGPAVHLHMPPIRRECKESLWTKALNTSSKVLPSITAAFPLAAAFQRWQIFLPVLAPEPCMSNRMPQPDNLQSWRLPCETFRFTSFTSAIISWYHDRYSMPYPLPIYTYVIYSYII